MKKEIIQNRKRKPKISGASSISATPVVVKSEKLAHGKPFSHYV